MNPRDLQRLLAAAGYYNGAIDGIIGRKTDTGVDIILRNHPTDLPATSRKWGEARRRIAAAQLVLKYAGYSVGEIDGFEGDLTRTGLLLWDHQQTYGSPLEIGKEKPAEPPPKATKFPKQSECRSFYGTPGKGGSVEKNLVIVELPFTMRIDYNLSQKSTRVQLHEKCADSAKAAMQQILNHYGETHLKKLGLDRNAGTYNPRKMRGGSNWSMHAYGCAWDFYAQPNGLTTRCPQALFCKEDYKAFFDIWEAHGWVSLGRAIGRDWMHVQAARL